MAETKAHPLHMKLAFVGLCIWNLMVAIDATALAIALPTIAQSLKANSLTIYWAGTAFVLCSAVFQPIFANITSFGHKPAILLALTFFTAGSLVCGLAHNAATLVSGRCVQGIGAGGLIILTYVVMAHLYTLQERAKYTSVIGLIWTVGTIGGPLIGGGFAQASWRWIFWLNLPLAGICYILTIRFMHIESPQQAKVSKISRLARIDWIGSFLFSSALALFLIAISWGGVMYPWRSVGTLVPLILGIVGIFVWIVYSYCFCKNPMIPLVVLKDRTAAISYFGTVIHGLAQFGLLYYLPLYYQTAKGYSPVLSAVALLPQCLLSGPFTAITGFLISKTHLTKPFNLIGWFLFVYGIAELTLLDTNTSVFGWIWLNIPSGIGMGILFASLSLATQASAEHRADCSETERMRVKAMAAGLNPFFRALGQAFGIAVGQAAFSNEMLKRTGDGNVIALVEKIKYGPVEKVEKVFLVSAFVGGLRFIWWILVALTAFVALLTFLTKEFGLGAVESSESRMDLMIEEAPAMNEKELVSRFSGEEVTDIEV